MADFLPESSEKLWGIVLSATNKSQIWPSEEQVSSEGGDLKLELSQATIGVGAKKGDRNVVEMKVLTEEGAEKTESFPIVSLKEGLLEHTMLNITVNPPVSFNLVAGTGPISLLGVQHSIGGDSGSESDDEGYEADESLVRSESQLKGKKRKMEASPIESKKAKPDPTGGKGDSAKEGKKAENGARKERIAKAIAGEDDGSSSDSDPDLDFGESSSIDDEGMDAIGQDENDDSASDIPEEKPQGKKQKKGKDKSPVSSEKKNSADAKGGKVNDQSLEAVKNKLRSNKTLPKTPEKFKNFLKGLKVTDTEQVSELWKFVEKLRKN